MSDFLITCLTFAIAAVIYTFLDFRPSFILGRQSKKLYKKNLSRLNNEKQEEEIFLDNEPEESRKIREREEVIEKEIKKLKDLKVMVDKTIINFNQSNKNDRNIQKIWLNYLVSLNHHNELFYDPYAGLWSINGDEIIVTENKLLAEEKNIRQIYNWSIEMLLDYEYKQKEKDEKKMRKRRNAEYLEKKRVRRQTDSES